MFFGGIMAYFSTTIIQAVFSTARQGDKDPQRIIRCDNVPFEKERDPQTNNFAGAKVIFERVPTTSGDICDIM